MTDPQRGSNHGEEAVGDPTKARDVVRAELERSFHRVMGSIYERARDEAGRLDLTVERHVLKPEFKDLFTDEERRIAPDRLRAYGMEIASG